MLWGSLREYMSEIESDPYPPKSSKPSWSYPYADPIPKRNIEILELLCDDSIKVVSFDVFDTLLVRPTVAPADIFYLIGKLCNIQYFHEKRQFAEVEARKYRDPLLDDIGIDDIYRFFQQIFKTDNDEIERIKQTELAVECDLLYAREYAKHLFYEAKKHGKEIIIVSDMYLPSEFINKALSKCGYYGYSKLYLSCEGGKSKVSTRLFRKILDDYRPTGLQADNILHIGDNLKSDIRAAEKVGIKTVWIPSPIASMKTKPLLREYLDFAMKDDVAKNDSSYQLGIFANMLFDNPFAEYDKGTRYAGNPYYLGINLALFFMPMAIWLMRNAMRDKLEKLVFMYDEGCLLEKIIDIFQPFKQEYKIETRRMYLSDLLRMVKFLSERDGFFNSLVERKVDSGLTIGDFIETQLLVFDKQEKAEVFKVFAKHGYKSKDDTIGNLNHIFAFIGEIEPFFLRNVALVAESAKPYVKQIFGNSYRIGFFQNFAAESFVRQLDNSSDREYFFYLPIKSRIDSQDAWEMRQSYVLATQGTNDKNNSYLLQFVGDVLSEPTGILTDLERNVSSGIDGVRDRCENNIGRSFLSQAVGIKSDPLRVIQSGIFDYSQVFVKVLGNYLDNLSFDPSLGLAVVTNVIANPNKIDAALFLQINTDSDTTRISNKSSYKHWYYAKFPIKKKINKKSKFEQFEHRIYLITKKMRIMPLVRSVYRFMKTKSIHMSTVSSTMENSTNYLEEQVDVAIGELHRSELLKSGSNLLFVGDPLPTFVPLLREIGNNFSEYNLVCCMSDALEKYLIGAANIVRRPYAVTRIVKPGQDVVIDLSAVQDMLSDADLQNAIINFKTRVPDCGRNFAEVHIYETKRYYDSLLDILKPKVVMLWNEFTAEQSVVLELARDKRIPLLFIESGAVPGTIHIDAFGEVGSSEPARFPEKVLKLPVDDGDIERAKMIINSVRETGLNRYREDFFSEADMALTSIARSRPTLVVIGQNDIDSGIVPYTDDSKQFHSPIFKSSADTINFIAKLCEKNNWNILFKPHPLEVRKNRVAKSMQNVVVIENGSVDECLKAADVTVSISSSTVYRSLILGKPVVLLGYTTLKGKGCSYEAFTVDSIEQQIKEAIHFGYTQEQQMAFERHMAQMCKYYLFDDLGARSFRYGRTVAEAAELIQSVIREKESIC
jgi:FMN phosphatase YigB (HAD superfamily)